MRIHCSSEGRMVRNRSCFRRIVHRIRIRRRYIRRQNHRSSKGADHPQTRVVSVGDSAVFASMQVRAPNSLINKSSDK